MVMMRSSVGNACLYHCYPLSTSYSTSVDMDGHVGPVHMEGLTWAALREACRLPGCHTTKMQPRHHKQNRCICLASLHRFTCFRLAFASSKTSSS
jgi:hypothetical protein